MPENLPVYEARSSCETENITQMAPPNVSTLKSDSCIEPKFEGAQNSALNQSDQQSLPIL